MRTKPLFHTQIARRGVGQPPDHGQHIYAFHHIRTNQVLYSLDNTPHPTRSLKQFPDTGANTTPPRIRKDHWKPFFSAHFNTPLQGLDAFRKLREWRKLHELAWTPPKSLSIPYTEEQMERLQQKLDDRSPRTKKEDVHDLIKREKRKIREREILDQKANSVADLAAVLHGQQERKGPLRAARQRARKEEVEEMRKLAKRAEEGGIEELQAEQSRLRGYTDPQVELDSEAGFESRRDVVRRLNRLKRMKRRMQFASKAVKELESGVFEEVELAKERAEEYLQRQENREAIAIAAAAAADPTQTEARNDNEKANARLQELRAKLTELRHQAQLAKDFELSREWWNPHVSKYEKRLRALLQSGNAKVEDEIRKMESKGLPMSARARAAQVEVWERYLPEPAQVKEAEEIVPVERKGLWSRLFNKNAEPNATSQAETSPSDATPSSPSPKSDSTQTAEEREIDYMRDLPSFPDYTDPYHPETFRKDSPELQELQNKRRELYRPVFTLNGVTIRWRHMLDAEYAQDWPEAVEHEPMGLTGYAAPKLQEKALFDVGAFNKEKSTKLPWRRDWESTRNEVVKRLANDVVNEVQELAAAEYARKAEEREAREKIREDRRKSRALSKGKESEEHEVVA